MGMDNVSFFLRIQTELPAQCPFMQAKIQEEIKSPGLPHEGCIVYLCNALIFWTHDIEVLCRLKR